MLIGVSQYLIAILAEAEFLTALVPQPPWVSPQKIQPEYRVPFIEALSDVIPNLPIELIDLGFSDLDEEEKKKLERAIEDHNSKVESIDCADNFQ